MTAVCITFLAMAVEKPILIGGGTDGASVCIGEHNSMKGKLQSAMPYGFSGLGAMLTD